MNNSILDICKLFYVSNNLPIYVFKDNDCIVHFSPSKNLNPMLQVTDSVPEINPYIITTNSNAMWGIIQLKEGEKILIGPAYSTHVSNKTLREYMQENAISPKYKDDLTSFFHLLPRTSLSQLMNKTTLLYYCLTGDLLDPMSHFSPLNVTVISDIAKEFTTDLYESKENDVLHNTYHWEKEMYHLIANGDTVRLTAFLSQMDAISNLSEGKMADTQLRQTKNILIGAVTKMGMLGAIPGGMNVEETYSLIDSYVRECESLLSVNQVYNLCYTAAIDFCSRVSASKIPEGVSESVYKCMEYIRNHTNEHIDTSDVARHINQSNSYVIQHFKKELGINVGAYISRCKLEEAKSLLTFSDKSLSDISNYLCFSSQSYFQNVFKKQYGVTPLEYRMRHHKN